MKVLSLFDGISCGRIALERAGIPVETYYASEIDKYAMSVAQAMYPDTIQIGDVCKVDFTQYIGKVDMIIGGSPCQDLSIAKQNRQGLQGERSRLFWEYIKALTIIKPKYFLLENIASIIKWHEQTFPDATLEGQIKKFYEEYGEFLAEVELNDITAYHFELADCFIVACGVCRFSLVTATKFFSQVYKLIEEYDITDKCFVDDVRMKMQTNRNRKWSIGKGNYQHIEEGEEE